MIIFAGEEHSAIAGAAEIFRRVEAQTADRADRAGAPAAIVGADRLRGVFNYRNTMLCRRLHERLHVHTLPIQMHRYDCFSSRGDGCLDTFRVEVECRFIDIDKNGPAAQTSDGCGGGKKGERRSNDFVAWANAT